MSELRVTTEGAVPSYTSADLARLTGASQRQIQYWCENHILKPTFVPHNVRTSGHSRRFSQDQVFWVALFQELRRKGIALHHAKRIANRWDSPRCLLITDGVRAWSMNYNPGAVVKVFDRATKPLLLVHVWDLKQKVEGIKHNEQRRDGASS